MSRATDAFRRLTLDHPENYFRMTLWRILDSIASSLPAGIMIAAVWFFLEPITDPARSLNVGGLGVCLAALAVQCVLSYLTSRKIYYFGGAGTADIVKEAQLELGEKLRRLPLGFYNRHDAGDLSSVLLRDYSTVEHYGGEILGQVGALLARLLVAIGAFVAIDWRMALAMIAVIPLALPFLFLGFRQLGQASEEVSKAQRECDSKSIEYVAGIRTLKAFGLAGKQFKALEACFDTLRRTSVRKESASRPVAVFGRLVLSCGLGILMWVGCSLLGTGGLSPFLFVVFLLVALHIYEPVISLFYFLSDFAHADMAAMRIEKLRAEPELPEPSGGDEAHPHDHSYSFNDVSFAYGGTSVLNGISLRTPPKGMTALVGPSGSGKSTIVRLMARFWDPDEGAVCMGDASLSQMKSDSVLEQIGMVFQDVYLFDDTVAGNIRMGRVDATDEEVVDAAKRAACHEFISELPQGYQTWVGENGSTLSGGERQRISIARALLKDAPVVLLDEATASLDPENEVLIQQAIEEAVRKKTVVVIAHRLRSVRHADRIVVLDDGRVVEEGTHHELVEGGGLYARMWNEQQKAGEWRI